ncbi:MAG: hypothetical protein U1E28_14165 [Beijerinckiaceae bacterium]
MDKSSLNTFFIIAGVCSGGLFLFILFLQIMQQRTSAASIPYEFLLVSLGLLAAGIEGQRRMARNDKRRHGGGD